MHLLLILGGIIFGLFFSLAMINNSFEKCIKCGSYETHSNLSTVYGAGSRHCRKCNFNY